VRIVLNVPILALALALILPPTDGFAQRRLLRVEVKDRAQFEKLAPLNLDIASSLNGSHVDVLVEPGDAHRIALLGFKYDVLIDDLESHSAGDFQQDLGDYHTYSECTDRLFAAAAAFPQICRVDSIGRSYFQRPIWALKISDRAQINDPNEADILFVGLHHAREVATPNVLIFLMDHLLYNYGIDAHVTHLVNDREIWIVPVLNPDGHITVEQGDLWWRKNMRPPPFGNCAGVDINRNYGYNWGIDNIGSSPNPCASDYRGIGPFSEFETRAVRDLVLDDSHQFKVAVSYHSYGRLILFPWGYTDEPSPDHYTYAALGDSMAAYNGYRSGASYTTIYRTNGDFDDWMYGDVVLGPLQGDRNPPTEKDRIFSFTFEVGATFKPPESMIPQIVSENLRPNLFIIEYGDDPYRVWPPETPEMQEPVLTAAGGWQLRWITPPFDSSNPPVAFELEKASGTALGTDDLESGLDFWDAEGFELSQDKAFSGSQSLHTGNASNFHATLEPVYSLHPVIGDSLTFKCWYSLPLGHNFFIEASDDGGKMWFPLPGVLTPPGEAPDSFHGLLTGESGDWVNINMSLAGYVGKETLIRFRCSTIGSEPTGGVYIDDIGPIVTFRDRGTMDLHLTSGVYDVEPSPESAIFRARALDADGQYSRWSETASVAAYEGKLRRLSVTPNPISSATRVRYLAFDGNSGSESVPVKLEVFDVAGRLVRTLFRGQVQGDVVHEKTWDGLSNDGSLLPSGVYCSGGCTPEGCYCRSRRGWLSSGLGTQP